MIDDVLSSPDDDERSCSATGAACFFFIVWYPTAIFGPTGSCMRLIVANGKYLVAKAAQLWDALPPSLRTM